MDDQRLRSAVSLAATGSLRKTAERMFCSQSTLSDSIKSLERDLGCTLFQRGSRGMVPTDSSEAVFAHMRLVIAAYDKLRQSASDFAGGIGGRVRVRCVLSATESIVPLIYRSWAHEMAGLQLDIDVSPPQKQLIDLEAGECDIGLLRAPVARQGFNETIILREPLVILVPKEWQQKHRLEGLEDIQDFPMVRLAAQHGPGLYPETCRILQSLAIDPRIECESDDMSALIAMVAGGVGWAIVPASLRYRHAMDVAAIDDKRLPTTDLAAVYYGSTASPFQQRFIDFVAEIGGNYERELRIRG